MPPVPPPERPLRVAVVAPMWPYRGGIAHFATAMARNLVGRGHDVRTVTFSRQYPERLFPGKTQLDGGPPPPGVPRADRLLDTLDPRTWTRAADEIADGGTDVAVIHYWMPFVAPALGTLARALRRRGVRVVTVVHNALPHEPGPLDRPLARYALSAADGLVVMSTGVRADVGRLGVRVPVREAAHPAYDHFGAAVPRAEARATLGLPHDAPVLLFFGFVRRYKGIGVLLDAMPAVVAAVPGVRLVVAGEFYGDEGALRAQARPLGDAVRFDADYIPDDRVGLYFGAADAVVQPYLSATQSGVAGVAFHFGRPVVTTDVGGLAADVGDAGIVVPPNDAAALADALVRVLSGDTAARLGALASQRGRASWDSLSEAVEEVGAA
jgi:D-inositol-3-phosphate glycosyltransferase